MVSGAERGSIGAGRVATVTISMLAVNVTHASVVLVGKRIGLNTICYRPGHVGRGAACIAKCYSNCLSHDDDQDPASQKLTRIPHQDSYPVSAEAAMEIQGNFEARKLKLLNDLSNQFSWKDREEAVRELAQDTAFVQMHIDLFALMLDDEVGLVRAAAVEAVKKATTDGTLGIEPLESRRINKIGKRVLFALSDEHYAVRRAALRTLSHDPEVLLAPYQGDLLERLADERSPEMRSELLLAIRMVPAKMQVPEHVAFLNALTMSWSHRAHGRRDCDAL